MRCSRDVDLATSGNSIADAFAFPVGVDQNASFDTTRHMSVYAVTRRSSDMNLPGCNAPFSPFDVLP